MSVLAVEVAVQACNEWSAKAWLLPQLKFASAGQIGTQGGKSGAGMLAMTHGSEPL